LADNIGIGTGRRKTAVARVYLRQGTGAITINGKELNAYFPMPSLSRIVKLPLEVTDNAANFDVLVNVKGGGPAGQADACKLGLSRALVKADESNHSSLRANGFLRRDSRMVERKKYGRRGARRRFQFSKR
jgi:small subunit ribosomal protein S9